MKRLVLLLAFFLLCNSLAMSQASFKLFRFGGFEQEKPAVELTDGTRLDVSAFGEDYNEHFFATDGIKRLQTWLASNAAKCPKVAPTERFGSCVARPSKIVGIGLNYAAHAAESNQPIPKEPVLFLKSTTSLSGPNDNIPTPNRSTKLDWEAELAIIIGKKASYVSEADAMSYVAGFATANDVSERNFQLERTGQWTKGKSADGFCPLGPYLVTTQDIADPQNLNIWLTVNGQKMQQSNTSDMVFGVKQVVSTVSQFMTLLPGDVIVTGTPSGVGLGHKPTVFLKDGDVVALGIDKLGNQQQKVISFVESQLTPDEYKDYQAWVGLGLGGLPHTLEGYRTVKMLGKQMKDPIDVGRVTGDIGSVGDVKGLSKLPKREGQRPQIAPFAVPHRQVNQHNSPEIRALQQQLFDEKVAKNSPILTYKLSYLEKHNHGIFVADSASGNPTLMPVSHAEIGHIHPTDGSMHIILSPSDTKEVIEKGWGELHGLAGQDKAAKTYLMIYSPRDQKELAVTKKIIDAAVKYSTYVPK